MSETDADTQTRAWWTTSIIDMEPGRIAFRGENITDEQQIALDKLKSSKVVSKDFKIGIAKKQGGVVGFDDLD